MPLFALSPFSSHAHWHQHSTNLVLSKDRLVCPFLPILLERTWIILVWFEPEFDLRIFTQVCVFLSLLINLKFQPCCFWYKVFYLPKFAVYWNCLKTRLSTKLLLIFVFHPLLNCSLLVYFLWPVRYSRHLRNPCPHDPWLLFSDLTLSCQFPAVELRH